MIKRLAALVAPLLIFAAPAEADGWKHRHHGHHKHHWHGHHHKHHWHGHRHRHGSASIVFWGAPVYRPYYPPPRVVYAPPPVVYAPAPVYAPQVAALPTRDFRDAEGRYCREYQRTAIIDGREQQIYGTACQMPDGAWRIVAE